MRLEKQILAGRQYVRRQLRSTGKLTLDTDMPNPELPGRPFNNVGGYEPPMSADTDAETAFAKGAQYFFRSTRAKSSGSPRPDGADLVLEPDISRRDVRRRKAVSDLFEKRNGPLNALGSRAATPDPPAPDDGDTGATGTGPSTLTPPAPAKSPSGFFSRPPSPSAFFSRLRGPFPSPFASMRRGGAQPPVTNVVASPSGTSETNWSSDSSDTDSLGLGLRFEPSQSTSLGLVDEALHEEAEPDVDV
jgi:hypothetical protein